VAGEDRWIDLLDPDEEALRRALPREVHPRTLEQLLAPAAHDDEPRSRFEAHGDYIFGVFVAPHSVRRENRVYYQEVDLVITQETVVTVRKTPEQGVPFRSEPLEETMRLAGDCPSGMIAYYVVDQVAEQYLDLVDELADEVDELEDGIETWEPESIRSRIGGLRRDILQARRMLGPARDAVGHVVGRRIDVVGEEIFPRDIELNFGDAYDKLLRSSDGLELIRDLVAGARDYHQAKIATEQNEVMKRLTAVAAILLFPTFLVGVYGQNFVHMPELRWRLGYLFSWGVIVVVTLLQLWWFRRKRWL
jgi:magnesium transporter